MITTQNKAIINTIKDLHTVDILSQYPVGKFRHIVKVKAGYLTSVDARDFDNINMSKNPETIINGYNRGSLQTVQFCPEGSDFYLTIFARVGKKIKFMDESIMSALTVTTVNGDFDNTNLMDRSQYDTVNATTWESKVFTMNVS
jgi:hypothetical protein